MDENTPTPNTPSDADLATSLRAQAVAVDYGKSVDTPGAAADAQPTPGTEDTQSGNAPAANPPTDKTTPEQPKANPPPPADKPTEKQPTEYQKKRTDRERLGDSWKKLEAEKAQLREEREAFYRRQAEQAQRGNQPAPKVPADDADPLAQYTPEQLDSAADEFDAKGQFDLAEEARKAAKAKREQPASATPPTAPQPGKQPPDQDTALKAAHAEWKANLAACEKEMPELADKTSEGYKQTCDILRKYPVLRTYPAGIRDAVQLVQLQRTASKAETAIKEVETLKSRLAEAESRLTPAIGAPERGGRTKSIADMGDAEARAALKRLAAEADAY